MITLKVTKIGNSAGLLLPKEILAKFRVTHGDRVILTETSEGFRITPYDPRFRRQLMAARKNMKNILRELAK